MLCPNEIGNLRVLACHLRNSPVSFFETQVLGHMKTVCVLLLGWIIFDSVLTSKNMMGMLMAVIGMITYSWAVEVAKAQAAKMATIKVKDPAYSDETLLLNKDDLEYGKSDKE